MEEIEGRVAFVSGAASGIGLGIAEALVAAGAHVVMADWDEESLTEESTRLGPATLGVHLDVRDRPGWEEAKRVTEDAFGPVDILVNNAGVAPGKYELVDIPPEAFDRLIGVNLTGIFNGVRTFGPSMRERGQGHIVNTASMAGLVATAGLGGYTASKFAVVGLSEVLCAEMEPHGIGVSILCSGLVATNLGIDRAARRNRAPHPLDAGMAPSAVASYVLEAIRANDMYVITHPESASRVAPRVARLREALEKAVNR